MVDMASLVVRMDTSDLRRGRTELNDLSGAAGRAEGSAGRAGSSFRGMAVGVAVAAASALAAVVSIAALSSQLNRFIDATVTNEKAQAQLGAAILSTGGAAGRSVAQLNEHAAALQKVTNFGDEATNAMQGVLLTFTQISGDQFDAATVAVQNVATAMGTDLQSAALQVGKALNDPVLGMTALSRSGIQFTDAQKEMVKEMVAANDVIGAQTIILAELEKQFGGSAEAARNTLGGAMASLRNAFGDLFELSGPGSENLRASIERLTAAVANPAFFAAVQSIGTALFAAAEMGVNALATLLPVITAVVENIDVIAYSAGIAAAVFAGPYVVAMGAAAIASFSLSGALAILKTALISTGIGALVVGAGFLVAMFGRLVGAAGGFGEAMKLLGNVASGVFEGIKTSADAIPASLAGVWSTMSGNFQLAVSDMIATWAGFLGGIGRGLESLAGIEILGTSPFANMAGGMAGGLFESAANANRLSGDFAAGAGSSFSSASTSFADASTALATGFDAAASALGKLNTVVIEIDAVTEGAAAEALALNTQLETLGGDGTTGSGGGTAGKAAAAIEEATTFAGGFAEAMNDGTKSAVEMGRELGGALLNGIGSVSDAFADFVVRGFSDFKGFVRSILDSFKSMLAQMISMAVRNRIMIGLGFSGGGAGAGGVAAQALGGGGAGGGGLLGGMGGLLGGFGKGGSILGMGGLGGGTGLLGGLGNALSGGLGNIFSVGANAAAAGGGMLASVGAALPIIGAIGLAFSFFRKRTKELDAGIMATVDGMGTLVQTFSVIQTKRFWGLSKRVRTHINDADEETTTAITNIVDALQGGVLASADALGIAASTFDNFAYSMRISTRGLSEESANKAIQDALMGMADAMAGMVGGLAGFAIAGEGSAATLERLALSLVAVNGWMGNFRMNLYEVSLAGGGAAAAFVALFGSLENFNAVSQSYYQNFFTDAERIARATELLSIEMLALGIDTLPSTRAAFRALVDEADALGDSGLVASLMQLSPAFAEISAGADALGGSLRSLVNEDLFSTGQDYMRALSRAGNSQPFTPLQSDAELRAELRALNVSMERLVSSSEITAGNTGRGADAADDTLAFQLEQTL